jgi:regulator of sirC expression with transglutaminase-like and TPR domain
LSYTPAYCHPHAYEAFRRELDRLDQPMGLFRAASAIALHARPEGSVEADCAAVEKLADAIRGRVQSPSDQALVAHLHDVLFEVAGFHGAATDFYNPANSYLGDVLRTRRGIPISLAMIYRTTAALVGLRAEGVNAPGHFLVSLTLEEGGRDRTMYVDPFHGGGLLNEQEALRLISSATGRQERATPQTLAIATPSDWLLRMLRNLQGVFAYRGQQRDLLAMQELQAALGC